jgi:hypothetical protein
MSLILDAGAFLAIERGDRDLIALAKRELLARRVPRTHGGIVGQVWRGGAGRQARLAPFFRSVTIMPLDEALGFRAGLLLRDARRADVVDAALVLLANDGDMIMTADPGDIVPLAAAAGIHVDIVPV